MVARIALVPMILLSLSATVVFSVPFFVALIFQCFPSLAYYYYNAPRPEGYCEYHYYR